VWNNDIKSSFGGFFLGKISSNEAIILNVISKIGDKSFNGESKGRFIDPVFELKILITAYVMFKEIELISYAIFNFFWLIQQNYYHVCFHFTYHYILLAILSPLLEYVLILIQFLLLFEMCFWRQPHLYKAKPL
jgi:hypothetical protein